MKTNCPKLLRRKTIANVEIKPYKDSDGRTGHDPTIYFTDGSILRFAAEEMSEADYGVRLLYYPKRKAPK